MFRRKLAREIGKLPGGAGTVGCIVFGRQLCPRFSRVTVRIHAIFTEFELRIPSAPCILFIMITIDEREESAEMVEEQVELLAHSHPCEVCGAESRYLWAERGMKRQACERCAPRYMKLRAA